MKENNKSKMLWNVPICSIAALFKGVYFSSGKKADGLVIFLIVP
jgi:hypothetical protein